MRIWVRPVPNVDYNQSEIIPLINPVSQKPLDMTYSFLRGASVMYTDYLKNMEVAMALTLSIVVDGKLWGLVACHHNTPKMIAWPVRAACELLAQIGSLQLKSAENAQFSAYREQMESTSSKIIEEMMQDNCLVSDMLTNDMLSGFVNASGTAVLENDKWTTHGLVPTTEQLNHLANSLKEKFHAMPAGTHILHTQSITQQLPEAEAHANIASGVLAMSISRNHDDMVLWFRPELVQTVNWAGDPYTKPIENSPHGPRLMPRSSFALWQESVRAQSEPWKMIEIEAAKRLREALGIDAKNLDTIFQKFVQADSSINRKYGGTGLGLAITKTLTDVMGGVIDVQSEVGKGTTFSIRFPMCVISERPVTDFDNSSAVLNPASPTIDAKHILLVEDYEPNILVATTFLEGFGFEYDVARNGMEALEKIKEAHHRFSVILMDVQMHGINGFETTQLIREYEASNSKEQISIIGMTAHALMGDKERCIEAGMNDYIAKPFNPDELQRKIESYQE